MSDLIHYVPFTRYRFPDMLRTAILKPAAAGTPRGPRREPEQHIALAYAYCAIAHPTTNAKSMTC
ncbi:hypothetical protein FNYG_01547 [Fusarium nygamai]|uniref:Uncharacterized protein n=1 Tax=Gibberella nygamai TaxID=42673 RepID=A0A2K0WRU7_GIBNY|nr:hypothetical protein FNYG_01547 [Fusarium nygamai]